MSDPALMNIGPLKTRWFICSNVMLKRGLKMAVYGYARNTAIYGSAYGYARVSTKYGYARVSTNGQDLGSQEAELLAAGCAKVFKEKVSGAKTDRAELAKLIRACTHKSPSLVRFRANQTLSRHRRMTEVDLGADSDGLDRELAGCKMLTYPLADDC
jgi:hypothetical protein